MKAVIQAGGRGTRLSNITKDEIPKPMVEILGKPLLQWQLEKLKENDIDEVIIIIGYLGHKIKEYFDDGNKIDIKIKYIEETAPLGTGGALYFLKEYLRDEDFILVYGDVFFDIDLSRMYDFHKEKGSISTLFAHPNSHPFDSDLVEMDKDNKVINFDLKNNIRNYWYENLVNSGIYIFNTKILDFLEEPIKTDLEKEILFSLAMKKEKIYAYKSTEYIKDAGTVERLFQVEEDVRSGFTKKRNLKNKQKCIFLDRDGTINVFKGLLYKEEDFELTDGAIEAIRMINNSDYLGIAVTNQPVVARGLCLEEDINRIHNKMWTLLGEKGVYLDDISFCPHHPDKGYIEENPAYKIVCECRKPKIGMLEQFVNKYNIDLKKSWMVGDTTVDIQTGINAGTKTALILTGEAGKDGKYQVKPDFIANNLIEAIKKILNS